MLHEMGETGRSAECGTCHRRSPIVAGTEREMSAALSGFGWTTNDDDADWHCPICAGRRSGQYDKMTR
jgi:rubrerythrin